MRPENAPECGAQYGSNPDRCYQPEGHTGTHSNRYGCTWRQDGPDNESEQR